MGSIIKEQIFKSENKAWMTGKIVIPRTEGRNHGEK